MNDFDHLLNQRTFDHDILQTERRKNETATGWYHFEACPICRGTVFETELRVIWCLDCNWSPNNATDSFQAQHTD